MVETRSTLRRRRSSKGGPPVEENECSHNGNHGSIEDETKSYTSWRQSMFLKTRRRPRWLELLGVDTSSIAQWRRTGLGSVFFILIVALALSDVKYNPLRGYSQSISPYLSSSNGASRHLLSNESESTPVWEDCTFENNHTPGAWVFFHSVCIIIIFIALAIICDDFFVPSLEAISEKLHLSEDVAGATFMAAGSSAPELFTSVAGVAVETDVGVGTIVGSAVFNILIIIALTAALAGQVLHLDWRPLIRDSFFYAMSIGCFIGFAWDGYYTHYEAVILLLLYTLYIVLMFFNPRIMDWMGTWKCCCKTEVKPSDSEGGNKTSPETPDSATQDNQVANSNSAALKSQNHTNSTSDMKRLSMAGGHARRLSLISQKSNENDTRYFHHHQRGSLVAALSHAPRKSLTIVEAPIKEENPSNTSTEVNEEDEDEEETMQLCPCLPCCPPVRTSFPSAEEAKENGGCANWMKFILKWLLWIPAFPFVCIFSWTIPDCSKEHNRKWFLVSFLASVFWIAVLSFGMVTLVSRVGCILNVDSYTMGLVVIAIGTSIPDALSSILVARDGYGDMAVSNAIGSNVFDINLGIGLPFIIRIAIDGGAPISLLEDEQWVHYYQGIMPLVPHAKFGFILLIILAMALGIFSLARFRLNKVIGVSFVCMYAMFLTYAFIQELVCVQGNEIYC